MIENMNCIQKLNEVKQLAITNGRCIGDGDLVFRTRHILISNNDLNFIKDICKKIYKLNEGNIDSVIFDEWSRKTYFSDIYKFFIKNETPVLEYYFDSIVLMKWDEEITVKTIFKKDELYRLLKVWELGFKRIRTCWGNKEDSIKEYPKYYCDSQKERIIM